MKSDEIYEYYINYLLNRLTEGKISNGSFSLLKISKNSFDDFKYKFENDKHFSKVFIRDKKIDDLLDEDDR